MYLKQIHISEGTVFIRRILWRLVGFLEDSGEDSWDGRRISMRLRCSHTKYILLFIRQDWSVLCAMKPFILSHVGHRTFQRIFQRAWVGSALWIVSCIINVLSGNKFCLGKSLASILTVTCLLGGGGGNPMGGYDCNTLFTPCLVHPPGKPDDVVSCWKPCLGSLMRTA